MLEILYFQTQSFVNIHKMGEIRNVEYGIKNDKYYEGYVVNLLSGRQNLQFRYF